MDDISIFNPYRTKMKYKYEGRRLNIDGRKEI